MANDIAIIGISVEVPGARDTASFWRIASSGASLTRAFPAERREQVEEYVRYFRETSVDPIDEPTVEFHNGCFLDRIDEFDPEFFGMNPKQASTTDPHQRLILRNMYLALEDAGYDSQRLRNTRTGVYVGYASNPGSSYLEYVCRIDPSLSQLALAGNIPTMMANRLSHFLGLRGPSMVIDSACSASLLAVHQARNAIRLGDCDVAVVAGARIVFAPVRHPHSRIGIESSDGVTRTFDRDADGTGFGEGSGAVILKPLDRAVADGDRVYAVIKGSAVNHDGTTEGITNPDSTSQADLLLAAWRDAAIEPRSIGYLEAHGTATQVGDPVEYEGLRLAFARHTDDQQFCAIGTVKSNIGHLFEGSGVMGLIKAALMLRERTIVPLANFQQPNPKIDFTTGPLYIPTDPQPWEAGDGPRRCGVSAFGLGGTNAHVVLEEYADHSPAATRPGTARVFTLSAQSSAALTTLTRRYLHLIDHDQPADSELDNICYTTRRSRSAHGHRVGLIVDSVADLRAQLAGEPPHAEPDPALAAQVRRYVDGGPVSELPGPVRARVVDLPGYPFDESRCWIGFPDSWRSRLLPSAPAEQHPVTHTIEFRPAPPPGPPDPDARTLVLVDPATEAERLLAAADLGEVRYLRLADVDDGEEHFALDPASFGRIADLVLDEDYTHVVYALAFETSPVTEIAALDRRISKNLYGLFQLSQALMSAGAMGTLVVLTHKALAASAEEHPVVTENAAPAGFGKVITREYPYLKTKHVDVDLATPPSSLQAELLSPDTGLFVLRGNDRRQEVFGELPEVPSDGPGEYLRPGGTYLVTGGTGAIGLAVSKAFATIQPDITLVLLSRSGAPPREQWPQTLATSTDSKLVTRVRALQELIDLGADVVVCPVDVGDPDALAEAVTSVQAEYGRVDGIVHAAGVPGGSSILFRDLDDFASVVRPKVHGAFVLDSLTRADPPDFTVHFSSVATVFPAPGQGDYSAANYYLDNLARSRAGGEDRILALDWVAWRDIGMAVDYGTNGDTTFKSLPTALGLSVLDAGLRSRESRIFVGEVHYDGVLVHMLESYDVTLSPEVATKVERSVEAAKERLRQAAEKTKQNIQAIPVRLTGRADETYSAVETTVAQCLAHAFGYDEIDVNRDFFDMGGDSIMAASTANNIATCLDVRFDVADMLSRRTVAEMARHIESAADPLAGVVV